MRRVSRMAMALPRSRRSIAWWLGSCAAVAVVAFGGYAIGAGTFSSSRRALESDRDLYVRTLTAIRGERTERPALERSIQSFADRTLGADLEAADSALRARLNRIGEELGIANLSVATVASTPRLSPAKSQFDRSPSQRDLRAEVDFVELQATMSGAGTLEEILRLLHRIERETWVNRLDGVRIDSERDGERARVGLKLTTLFLPGHRPDPEAIPPAPTVEPFERFASLVESNPFRVPPPEAPAREVAVKPRPPRGFPYHEWLLTGVLSGPSGEEAFLRNASSGERMQLAPGQSLGEVAFVGSRGELAEFSAGGSRFVVEVGHAMNERRATSDG